MTDSRHAVRSVLAEDDTGDRHPAVDAELLEDVAQVAVHGVRRAADPGGDLLVGHALRDEQPDGALRRGQPGQRRTTTTAAAGRFRAGTGLHAEYPQPP